MKARREVFSIDRSISKEEHIAILLKAAKFIEGIGPELLISVTERTECDGRIGDDMLLKIVVWYWERTDSEVTNVRWSDAVQN